MGPKEEVSSEWFVNDLIGRITETAKMARKEVLKTRDLRRKYYNKHAKFRSLNVGDKVFVLIPQSKNKMLLHHGGPYQIVEKLSGYIYKVNVRGKIKSYHVNMLKKFEDKQNISKRKQGRNDLGQIISHINTVIVDQKQDEHDDPFIRPNLTQTQTIDDVQIYEGLTDSQKEDVRQLLEQHKDTLTDVPGLCTIGEHKIEVTSDIPMKKKIIPTPYNLKNVLQEEIDKLLEQGFIEPCVSSYCQPVLLVKKTS